jgi:hypothetical protein
MAGVHRWLNLHLDDFGSAAHDAADIFPGAEILPGDRQGTAYDKTGEELLFSKMNYTHD